MGEAELAHAAEAVRVAHLDQLVLLGDEPLERRRQRRAVEHLEPVVRQREHRQAADLSERPVRREHWAELVAGGEEDAQLAECLDALERRDGVASNVELRELLARPDLCWHLHEALVAQVELR